MPSLAAAAAALFLYGPSSPAQDDRLLAPDVISIQDRAGFGEAFVEVVEGSPLKGAQMLQELRERWSTDPDRYIVDYNLACAYGRADQPEPTWEWLREAVDGGYGLVPGQEENLDLDIDLELLRGREDWGARRAELKQRIARHRQQAQARVRPFVWVPPPPPETPVEDGARPLDPPAPGILIVLHPYAVDPERFARAHFLQTAKARNMIVVAPYGGEIVSPGRWAWTTSPDSFTLNYPQSTMQIWRELQKVRREHRHDPDRIQAVGLGQGGSLAYALAARNPQWCCGAVVLGAPLAPLILNQWFKPAIHFGRRVVALHGTKDPLVPHARLDAYVQLCQGQGLDFRLQPFEGGWGLPGDLEEQLDQALDWIEAKPLVREPPDQKTMLYPGEGPRLPEGDR